MDSMGQSGCLYFNSGCSLTRLAGVVSCFLSPNLKPEVISSVLGQSFLVVLGVSYRVLISLKAFLGVVNGRGPPFEM